jgi:hypothetical protein
MSAKNTTPKPVSRKRALWWLARILNRLKKL